MIEICEAIPDPNVLLAMEPEELGLQLLVAASTRGGMFHPGNAIGEAVQPHFNARAYSTDRDEVIQALTEAWAWLEGQVLIVPEPDINGRNGFRRISRRGRRVIESEGFAEYRTSLLIPKELIHATIRQQTWLDFVRGDYDVAVLRAMKAVEIALRQASGLPAVWVGVRLARKAFEPPNGPLTDPEMEGGEQQARSDLFAGALGAYKNPQSHRHVALSDPGEAIEQIMLASNLLRIIDGCVARKCGERNSGPP